MKAPKIAPLLLAGILTLTACNMPKNSQTPSANVTPMAATPSPIPQNTPPSSTPSPTLTATTAPPTETITPTYSVPMVGVSERTNCRTGPGVDYDLVVSVNPGIQLEIIGAYPPQYWLIRTDYGDCWLYGEFATPVGSYWAVSSVTPPPSATNAPPEAPIIQNWDFYCNAVTGQTDVNLSWSDVTNGETGYHILRDGTVVADLPPNSVQYSETIELVSGESASYVIEVYTPDLSVGSSTITITCP